MTESYGWIVYNGNLVTEKFKDYVDWFQEAAKAQNILVEGKANNQLLAYIKDGKPELAGSDERLPDFVHYADKDLHLARHLELMGIPLFNTSRAIELCDNKALMHQYLANKGITTPDTIIAPKIFGGLPIEDESHIKLAAGELGLPLIIKEAYGSFGQQVYWVNTIEELFSLSKKLQGKEYVFQKPVMESLGNDIRLNVIGDKVVAAMKRTSATDFRANVTAGGKTLPYTPTEEEIELAVFSAKAVGAHFAGVDLLQGENGPLLCEINSNPHLRSIYECTGIDVATDMIQFIKENIHRKGRPLNEF